MTRCYGNSTAKSGHRHRIKNINWTLNAVANLTIVVRAPASYRAIKQERAGVVTASGYCCGSNARNRNGCS